jgi:hypothetical protein
MKLKPFEDFVGSDEAITYVGIRADEFYRQGYLAKGRKNIKARYPFKEDNLVKEDIIRILEESGVGLPEYYQWRSRSGCYFCFFQRKDEWIGLYERHPDLFEKAKAYEEYHLSKGRIYTWSQTESLASMVARRKEILAEDSVKQKKPSNLFEAILAEEEDAPEDQACPICSI